MSSVPPSMIGKMWSTTEPGVGRSVGHSWQRPPSRRMTWRRRSDQRQPDRLSARRWALIGAGFPLSFAATGLAAGLTPWAWLLPLAVLALVYPLRSWTDAPVFPTPRGALAGLARRVPLAPGARVLDAGCGLGDGLRALRRAYPQARMEGVEWSWPLRFLCALRCPWAQVRRGDMWRTDWSGYQLVYLFQRPESMARAAAKAKVEMAPGSWLVSLEFAVPDVLPQAQLRLPGNRVVWIYGMPGDGGARRNTERTHD